MPHPFQQQMDEMNARNLDHLTCPYPHIGRISSLILSTMNYEGQRPISGRHVRSLVLAMKLGDFRPFTVISFVVLGDKVILVNGQHTLTALAQCQLNIPVTLEFKRVKDTAEMVKDYSHYDNGRLRRTRDLMGDIGSEIGLTLSRERDALAAAVSILDREFRSLSATLKPEFTRSQKDAEVRKDLMRQWAPIAVRLFRALDGAQHKPIFYRSQVLAVAMATIRWIGDSALEFWVTAAQDDGLKLGDPRKSFINWMISSAGKGIDKQADAAIACWNAYARGQTYAKVYLRTQTNTRIMGTPYDREFSK